MNLYDIEKRVYEYHQTHKRYPNYMLLDTQRYAKLNFSLKPSTMQDGHIKSLTLNKCSLTVLEINNCNKINELA